MDDFDPPTGAPVPDKSPVFPLSDMDPPGGDVVGEMSSTSSSSSDSDSDSDANSTVVDKFGGKTNGYHSNGVNRAPSPAKVAAHLLNEDLCLSESGSDSD